MSGYCNHLFTFLSNHKNSVKGIFLVTTYPAFKMFCPCKKPKNDKGYGSKSVITSHWSLKKHLLKMLQQHN